MQRGAKGARGGLFGRLGRREDVEEEAAKADEEWRERLTPEQYRVLRQRGTEAPFTNQAVVPDSEGVYRCAACDATLFRADTKFDSGTGWPSFTDPEPNGVELHRDFRAGIPRTEVVCRRCGGHLAHVFNDGPGPTGKRYCINGCAIGPGERPGGAEVG